MSVQALTPRAGVTLHVLLVHHREDGCKVTPFAEIEPLLTALAQTTGKVLSVEDGGLSLDGLCQP